MRGRKWTKEDEFLLESMWGNKNMSYLCKKFNRSKNAIVLKARALNLGKAYDSGLYLLVTQVGDMLGYSATVVVNWITKYGLPAKKKILIESERYFIDEGKLVKWLKENQNLWNANNLQLNAFGAKVENDWLKEKRKKDINRKKKCERFSKGEIEFLILEYNKGKTYNQIAKCLGRTKFSVKEKARQLQREKKLNKKCILTKKTS